MIPGRDTTVDVESKVFLRDKVGKLGLAPLTSMYLFGPNQPSPTLNYRPALHDSNGLSIHAGNGEWIWRPLNNPKHLSVSTYTVENPKGFGLLQRGRNFRITKIWTIVTICAQAPGSNRRATGVKARSSWWRSRRRMKPTTISWRSGRRIRCRKPKAADAELPSELHPRRRQTAFARHRLCGADHAFDR